MVIFDVMCLLALLYCVFPIFKMHVTLDIAFHIFFITGVSFMLTIIALIWIGENKPKLNYDEG